jgi:hypothetical protein
MVPSLCYALSYTISAYPQNSSGFSYSDGRGNSISVGTYTSTPFITNDYPSAVWVDAAVDRIPVNMIVFQYINGSPAFYCRVEINRQWFYGSFITGDGCYVNNNWNTAFDTFQVLVR